MATETIETGAQEFFPGEGKDEDYIEFRKQDKPFVYEREPTPHDPSNPKPHLFIDYFCYREGLTKQEYFDWHFNDRWPLNFAPLVNKQFLEHLKIDIFGADKKEVNDIMSKIFTGAYALPSKGKFVKWLYRFYVYMSYMQNGRLELTEPQRAKALSLYKQDYSNQEALRELYQFFKFPAHKIEYIFARLKMQQDHVALPPPPQRQPAPPQPQPAPVPPAPAAPARAIPRRR